MHNIYIEFWGERKVMKKLSKYDKKKLEVHKRYDAVRALVVCEFFCWGMKGENAVFFFQTRFFWRIKNIS